MNKRSTMIFLLSALASGYVAIALADSLQDTAEQARANFMQGNASVNGQTSSSSSSSSNNSNSSSNTSGTSSTNTTPSSTAGTNSTTTAPSTQTGSGTSGSSDTSSSYNYGY